MPFRLTNGPTTFCNLMNDVLYEYLDRFVVVYLNDIVVYSESLANHLDHLRLVFAWMRGRSRVSLIGLHLQRWRNFGRFLGLANYYRKFIKESSKWVSVHTDLLKKDQKWECTEGCQQAFEKLKQAVASGSVLKLPDFRLPFEVHTDASDWDIGGMLVEDGHLVAFESRKLKDSEQSYSAHEKEMTAVVHCLSTWRHYLLGTVFSVVTDNVANTYFKTWKKLSQKQARWQEFLAEYDFVWIHRPRRQNQVADALSRKTVEAYVAALTTVVTDFLDKIQQQAKTDTTYCQLREKIMQGLVWRY